jgi:hypothetical protein
MAARKKHVLCEREMKRILEDSGREFDDDVSENENTSKSESDENVDENAEEISYSSDSDDNTAPQA